MTDVSIIIPIHNGEQWIDSCMKSIAAQTVLDTDLKIEIVICNDGSSDESKNRLEVWSKYFEKQNINFIVTELPISRGVGAAKNIAVEGSVGDYLCFQDIDDTMHPDRILRQWNVAKSNHNAVVGSQIKRIPENSTPRLVKWANNLCSKQLQVQIYTSNGPTVLMPTWFCHKLVYHRIGGFSESGPGTPEDLIFFYKHLDCGGDVYRVNEKLVTYTYHQGATTFSVKRQNIWSIQLERLEKLVLPYWDSFTVWNAGKTGRRFVRSLSSKNLDKVEAFCDIDKKKVGRIIELYDNKKRKVLRRIPVIKFSVAKPPLIICMKLDLTQGEFERNLKSMNLIEGVDYILFN